MTDTETTTYSAPGLIGTARRLLEIGIATVQNRLELMSLEIKEEKSRVTGMFVWGGLLIFVVVQALTAIMLTLAFLFRDQAVYVFAGFSAFYILFAIAAVFVLKSKLKPPFFGGTIHQLKRDRDWLKSQK